MSLRARRLPLFLLVILLPILSSCMVRNPLERQAVQTQWMMAMREGHYGEGEKLLRGPGVAAWRTEAERLGQQHGYVTALWRDDLVGYRGEAPFTSLRVRWADGYERCLRVRPTSDDHLELLDGGWQDCAAVPFNPTPTGLRRSHLSRSTERDPVRPVPPGDAYIDRHSAQRQIAIRLRAVCSARWWSFGISVLPNN